MSIVTLVSGGLDSTLMSVMIKEEGVEQFPVFINYGQICNKIEWHTVCEIHKKYGLPEVEIVDVNNYGKIISSGLTDKKKDIVNEAFLPGRNLLFLLIGSSYAHIKKAGCVAIGLLNEESHIFPDQTQSFLSLTEDLIKKSINKEIGIIAPLMGFNKKDVIRLAAEKGIEGTYSCHRGDAAPCGKCISCKEFSST